MAPMGPGLTRTLLALTFVTGIVDAVSFLGLGRRRPHPPASTSDDLTLPGSRL